MRIQTRLFLVTAALVLALVGVQWWLQTRQLSALETELANVAAGVSENLVFHGVTPLPLTALKDLAAAASGSPLAANGPVAPAPAPPAPPAPAIGPIPVPAVPPAPPPVRWVRRVEREHLSQERQERVILRRVFEPRLAEELARAHEELARARESLLEKESQARREEGLRARVEDVARARERLAEDTRMIVEQARAAAESAQPIEIRVETLPRGKDQVLVVSGIAGGDRRIPLPGRRTEEIVRTTLRQGLLASSVLLAAGLLGAAVIAHRVGRPLRHLATATERLGRGELGATIPVTARGEVGELQVAFNRMSQQLEDLEAERAAWRNREHLAQLGDLARGLGHTLRNPLNTLGLAVEELAEQSPESGRELAATARGQIRRIDRWLRSFLALGAGQAAQRETVDLGELARAVAFEAVQEGCAVEVTAPEEAVAVHGVPGALRAALANLVENACQASPPGASVQVTVECRDGEALVSVRDLGPGLPEEVRARLFQPHVTTRTGGSGMGLFLARQLVAGAHGGRLTVADAAGGGTQAVMALPADPGIDAAGIGKGPGGVH